MDEKNKQDPTVQEEAGLGPEWKVVNAPAITPSQPGVPSSAPNPMAPYFGGSISPTLQHDAIFVGTRYGTPAIPSLPLMPLSASGQPTVGSAIQSGSNTTIQTTVNAVAGGPNGAVQFNNGGALGGSPAFTWNNAGNALTILGSLTLSTPLAISSGGTGTTTPALIAGTDITITGPWPDETIAVKTQAGVVAGSYTNANVTVDGSGIVTAVSNGAGSAGGTVASVDVVGQSSAITSTTLYVVPASPPIGSNFLLSWNAKVTMAASGSSTLGPLTLTITSPDGVSLNPSLQYTLWPNGTTIAVVGNTSNSTTANMSMGIPILINVEEGSMITYSFGYTSSGTPMVYDLHIRLVLM